MTLVTRAGPRHDDDMPQLQCTRREDVAPVCPHCGAEIAELHVRKPRGPFGLGQGYLFMCPTCRKVLGMGTQWYPLPHT
jgi:uncharacterized protein with PIN domain